MSPPPPPSYFQLAAPDPPAYPRLEGSRTADVCVVGGGYTGLSAALHLAEAGAEIVLIEANRIGGGSSGRNGGQIHSGQRQDVLWLERKLGFARARLLWDMAEEAKALVRALIARFAIPCDLQSGVIEALHNRASMRHAERLVEALATRYGYQSLVLLDGQQTAAALGSQRYMGAVLDRGGGHLDPYRFALGLARAAAGLGAAMHEESKAISIDRDGSRLVARTARGEVRAGQVILGTDGRSGPLEHDTKRHVLGVTSFMVATAPLGPEGAKILPGGEAAADSRFEVRYWRKTPDGRLVFGGGESSAETIPADIAAFVRPQLRDVYPHLAETPIAHAWGGVVTVTRPRLPFVREIAPGIWAAAGYSGQGVALAPFIGKLLAEAVLGRPERLRTFAEIPIPAVPRTAWLRRGIVRLALWGGKLSDRL